MGELSAELPYWVKVNFTWLDVGDASGTSASRRFRAAGKGKGPFLSPHVHAPPLNIGYVACV